MNFNATLFGQLLAFVFFVWFTMQYVWPYILEALEEREKEISDGFEVCSLREEEILAGLRVGKGRPTLTEASKANPTT